ncbi:MAG: hypothetical protein ABIT20_10100 [Gemmatimonadaceae bacterium]
MRADVRAPAIFVPIEQERDFAPLCTQRYRQLREHILTGTIAAGVALPSSFGAATESEIRSGVVAIVELL